MAPNLTTRHTTKLLQLKEKMATLRQEEEKICQTLAQDLAQCLINAQALEIDFDTLIGGILEVVKQTQTNPPKTEVWKKSGQKFRRSWSQSERNKGGHKQEFHQPKQPTYQHPTPVAAKTEKVAEKVE